MIRRIVHIDQDKCNGCGACARACHEGAIDMVDGKAKLMRGHYCDGLGDCLPACPTGAITFEEREAPAYDEAAVKAAQAARNRPHTGCPGAAIRQAERMWEEGADIIDVGAESTRPGSTRSSTRRTPWSATRGRP